MEAGAPAVDAIDSSMEKVSFIIVRQSWFEIVLEADEERSVWRSWFGRRYGVCRADDCRVGESDAEGEGGDGGTRRAGNDGDGSGWQAGIAMFLMLPRIIMKPVVPTAREHFREAGYTTGLFCGGAGADERFGARPDIGTGANDDGAPRRGD